MMTDDSISHNFSFQSSSSGDRLFFYFPFSLFPPICFESLFGNFVFSLPQRPFPPSPPPKLKKVFWSIIGSRMWELPKQLTHLVETGGRTNFNLRHSPPFPFPHIYVPSLTAFISLSSFGSNRKHNVGAGRSGGGILLLGWGGGIRGKLVFLHLWLEIPPVAKKNQLRTNLFW